jgi:hypothetical protein
MSDNLRRYRAIREACTPGYPGQPSGTVARHVMTLAALLSGIVGSQSTPLPHSAAQGPHGPPPPVASNALRGGATTPVSWRRSPCCLMRTSCCVLSPCRRWCSSGMAAAWAVGVPRCGAMSSLKGAPDRWPGGGVKPRRGMFPQRCLSPWSTSAAGGCQQGRRWCGGVMGHAMAPGSRTPCSRPAGPPRAAQPRAL